MSPPSVWFILHWSKQPAREPLMIRTNQSDAGIVGYLLILVIFLGVIAPALA